MSEGDVNRALGRVEGLVEEVRARMDRADESRREQRAKTEETLSKVAAAVTEIRELVADHGPRLATAEAAIAEHGAMVQRFRWMMAGGAAVIAVLFEIVRLGWDWLSLHMPRMP